jgi:hypothetical protein
MKGLEDNISHNIRKSIVPAIFHLQKLEPIISLGCVLGEDLVLGRLFSLKLGPGALCSSLGESDTFFHSVKKK